uniref:Uncharacterized protein n=1 Tax=Lepeophtheirus salmonis TaxID=72036 RepID=A0A0K2SYA0_LEPSM
MMSLEAVDKLDSSVLDRIDGLNVRVKSEGRRFILSLEGGLLFNGAGGILRSIKFGVAFGFLRE